MSSDSRVRNRISPIQMNSGSAVSVHEALALQTVVASTEPIGTLVVSSMATKPISPRATAIHTPLARMTMSEAEQNQREIDEADIVHQPPPPEAMRSTSSSGEDGGSFS